MLQRMKSKKGFTLAELLIVVAIIAVLIAIAVPLFVGSVAKAEEAVFLSNQRAIKSMGVSILLTSDNDSLDLTDTTATYYAYATIDENNEIGEVKVSDKAPTSGHTEYSTWKEAKDEPIVVEIKPTTLGEFEPGT